MAGKFAAQTDVPVERSKAQIEATVARYGATSFISGWQPNKATIVFDMRAHRIRFDLPLPPQDAKEFTHYKVNRNASTLTQRAPEAAQKLYEQACRQLWRALLLVITAKLEAVESGIRTFEQEFLNDIVTADGQTVGELIKPQMKEITSTSTLKPLLALGYNGQH